MDERILIIDDEEPMHLILKDMLEDEFSLLHARNAQQGIDVVTEKPVDMILSDIHMPGMSGLEFLASLMKDAEKKNIPVLIMTSLPTVDKEKKALELGAEDFIEKSDIHDHPEKVIDRIRMKLVTNFERPPDKSKLSVDTKRLGKILMSEAVMGDFFTASRKFCMELKKTFNFDYLSQWSISDESTSMIMDVGKVRPDESYGVEELAGEKTYRKLLEEKEPYLCNHVDDDTCGIMTAFSRENDLPAEIGIPLFSLDEKTYLKNNRQIPADTPIFGFLVFKRSTLFTTKEFDLMKKLFAQGGTVLWRIFKEI